MSYEGYTQYLCAMGHYTAQDCWQPDPVNCPVCTEKIIWHNMVDITNGSFDEKGKRIDGYITLREESVKKCEHCGSILEIRYKIPKRKKQGGLL